MEELGDIFRKFAETIVVFVEGLERKVKDVDKWNGSASRWDSTDAYCSACLIDVNSAAGRDEKSQSHCMLPVREPGDSKDTFVRQAVHAAAGGRGIGRVKRPSDVPETAWDNAVKNAGSKMLSVYRQMDETAPDSVYKAAGKTPPSRAMSTMDARKQLHEELNGMRDKGEVNLSDYFIIHDVFVDDDGSMFSVVSDRGKLFRVGMSFEDGQLTLSELEQVEYAFTPVTARTQVVRQADGRTRWVSRSCTSVLNRVGEIDSRDLFDSFISHAEETGDYPYRTFYHQGVAFMTGICDFLTREGNVYVTSGLYDEDNELAQAEIEALGREPEYWGESIRYAPTRQPEMAQIGDVAIPVYRSGIQIEVSLLPESQAAAWYTGISKIQEVDRMSRLREALVKLFGDDEEKAQAFLESVNETNRQIEEENLITRSEEPVLEREVVLSDDEIQHIAQRAAEIAGEAVREGDSDLAEMLAQLTKRLDSIEAKITEDSESVRTRLGALERSDEEKHEEWNRDLPRRTRVTVTHRPRIARANNGDGASLADIAAATLSKMPPR